MKKKHIVLWGIGVVFLLIVVALSIFFARGGQVMYPHNYYVSGGGYAPWSKDKNVAEEIAKLHFVFYPFPELKTTIRGEGIISPRTASYPKDDGIVFDKYTAEVKMTIEGRINCSFPSGQYYVHIDENEFREALFKEIQSRISPDAEFDINSGKLWGNGTGQLKKMP